MSKYNTNCENQVILLMITNGKKWHYLAIKKLPALLRGVTSKHLGDFYCLNCFHSYSTEKNLKSIMRYVKIILESLPEKMSTCHNIPEKSSTNELN